MASEVLDNRYRLEERIAVGGMAEVWAAQDLELERRVALKLLLHTADPERFAREARAAAGLSHPSICQLYDYGESDGRPYIVLEYLEGGTLEDRLQAGAPLPDDESERIAREIASGLAHAHAHGLVHRDVKPGNVLFDSDGAVKITDFGIAQIADASTLTEAGTLLGTAAYISPEQARGERATAASDVYSFGVILYRMLTGGLPFESESALELAAMHESTEPPPITSRRPDPPPALAHLAMAALAKRPEERPADGSALVTALGANPRRTRRRQCSRRLRRRQRTSERSSRPTRGGVLASSCSASPSLRSPPREPGPRCLRRPEARTRSRPNRRVRSALEARHRRVRARSPGPRRRARMKRTERAATALRPSHRRRLSPLRRPHARRRARRRRRASPCRRQSQ